MWQNSGWKAEPFAGTQILGDAGESFIGNRKRTKIIPTTCSAWPSRNVSASALCWGSLSRRQEGTDYTLEFPLSSISSLHTLSSFLLFQPHHLLYSSPIYCFLCFSPICLSTGKKKKKTITFLPLQLGFVSSLHACMPSLTHVLVHLFSGC